MSWLLVTIFVKKTPQGDHLCSQNVAGESYQTSHLILYCAPGGGLKVSVLRLLRTCFSHNSANFGCFGHL